MKQDEIIEMAIQAELNLYVHDLTERQYIQVIETFAKLVAAKEREACANFVRHGYVRQFEKLWREDLSDAIRARGEA